MSKLFATLLAKSQNLGEYSLLLVDKFPSHVLTLPKVQSSYTPQAWNIHQILGKCKQIFLGYLLESNTKYYIKISVFNFFKVQKGFMLTQKLYYNYFFIYFDSYILYIWLG